MLLDFIENHGVKIWLIWVTFSLVLGLAALGSLGYAIYWGLSLAERAVDNAAPTTHQLMDE